MFGLPPKMEGPRAPSNIPGMLQPLVVMAGMQAIRTGRDQNLGEDSDRSRDSLPEGKVGGQTTQARGQVGLQGKWGAVWLPLFLSKVPHEVSRWPGAKRRGCVLEV